MHMDAIDCSCICGGRHVSCRFLLSRVSCLHVVHLEQRLEWLVDHGRADHGQVRACVQSLLELKLVIHTCI